MRKEAINLGKNWKVDDFQNFEGSAVSEKTKTLWIQND